MNSTLSNWTLHGQNLGGMLRNYKKQYHNLRQSQRRELCHFFNTASAVLDTIGSMTENSILRLVKFGGDEPSKSLVGQGMDNVPPAPLPPTNHNISRYVAFFPEYQLDRGHILEPDAPPDNDIFTLNYPPYPDSVKLQRNTNLPNVDKEYSTDDNSSTDESISFSSDEEEATGNERDESYI